MKTLVCEKPGSLLYQEKNKPELSKGKAIIRIRRVGICGTDLHAFEGTQPYFDYPRILGHELSGQLIHIDGKHNFELGEDLTIIPYYNCGHCIACRQGKTNCCVNMQVVGVHIDGAMVEYLSVPVESLIQGGGLSVDELALTEPLSISAHGVTRADIQPNEFVLVIGAGPIGMGAMELAKISGANVIALDIREQRLDFCRQQLQIPYVINAGEENVYGQVCDITSGDMPTVVIDATGNLKAINNSFQYLAHGGRYLLIGLQKEKISFSHPEFHKREATLMSSRNATRTDFELVINLIQNKKINPVQYISHILEFEALGTGFETLLDPKSGLIKAMIRMD